MAAELKPIDPPAGQGLVGECYRGEYCIWWKPDPANERGTLLCIECDCGQWWGWTYNAPEAFTLLDEMCANGCEVCA